jgi:hypothetical protein
LVLKSEITKLNRIIKLAEQLVGQMAAKPNRLNGKTTRIRRTGRELVQFRKLLKAQRRKGVSVADLARKHGVSTAYIYTLP